MKICHVLSAGYGCGQVVVDLLKAGVAAGHDMTLVYTPLRVEPRLAAVFEGMRDRVRVHVLPMTGEVGVSDLSCFWSLYRLLRHEGPYDVVHSHASKAGALARLTGLLLPRAVQIYTPQGFSTMSAGSSRAYGWIELMLSVIGTRIICVSLHEKSHGRELGIADDKLVTVWNGVEDTPLRANPGKSGKVRIVMVARFAEQKNQAALVRACSTIKQDFELVFAGQGPSLESVRQLAQSLPAARAEFLGDRSDIAQILADSGIFVLSTNWEGLPVSIVEAMRAGLPVIASNVGGNSECVRNGENGYLVPPGDEGELARRIEELIAAPDLRAQMGLNSRQSYERNFTVEMMVGKTARVYADAMGRNGAAEAVTQQ